MTDAPGDTRCGSIALLGAPNAGKSTLMNQLVGAKVAIVTPKVQTTRRRLLGIAVEGPVQFVYIDTPGIFAPSRRLERAMVRAAWRGAADADLVVVLVDAARPRLEAATRLIVAGLKANKRQAVLALNKVDAAPRARLLALAQELDREGVFTDVFMISALTGDGVGDLKKKLAERLPPGPWHFPADQLSDAPERFLAAEATREQLFLQLRQEVPYALTVESESWEDFADGSLRVGQVIFVQRDSQKAIVLGAGGRRIKSVREAAQRELQAMQNRKVHLFLHVKVREKWVEDPERYREMGLEFGV